ncbi:hypothetical protein HHK36_022728 [Tetracentron sinense]|uniref:DUF4220 domain-containing protein n=1 Tax=Tetracentron sinense TaxID=13715 RepID=A0A835D730_TETSI|nr:hypothetical protein HHK36_022728 [Tetracentron sinense]
MEIFSARVQKLWNKWDLRVMVLLSLFLQIILIFFGQWRKYTAKNWVRIILWFAYLSADWVATVSLGILANSQGESRDHSLDPNEVLLAFWAPFLLLHLGGPDTITAYSLEDNELWLRHLLGLLVQAEVAFYVFLRSLNGNRLSFLAIIMFVPGIIKYGERTWVLWSASSEHFQDSMLNPPPPDPNDGKLMEEYSSKKIDTGGDVEIEIKPEAPNVGPNDHSDTVCRNGIIPDASILPVAYYFFQKFKCLFADLIVSIDDLKKSRAFFKEISWEEAFIVVEMELGFMYNVFHTKSSIVYTRLGCILRSISFSSTISLFVVFLSIEKHGYSKIDIIIAHILLAGALRSPNQSVGPISRR